MKAVFVILSLSFVFPAFSQEVSTLVNGEFSAGNLLIGADNVIYASDFFGTNGQNGSVVRQIMFDGSATTFAAGLVQPTASGFDSEGNFYVGNYLTGTITRVDASGQTSVFASGLDGPSGLYIDAGDTIYVCNGGVNSSGNSISKITPDGSVSTFVTSNLFNWPDGLVADSENNLYVSNFGNGGIIKVEPDGNVTTLANLPNLSFGSCGWMLYYKNHLLVTSIAGHQIYKVTLDGEVSVIAGSSRGNTDGSLAQARFNQPNGLAASITGDTLFVSETAVSRLRMITGFDGVITSVAPTYAAKPRDFSLTQNFPNPFNPSTEISFEIKKSGPVSLQIYDIKGVLIKTLVNSNIRSGAHRITWDGTNENTQPVSSGVYFARLTQGEKSVSKRMVLLK